MRVSDHYRFQLTQTTMRAATNRLVASQQQVATGYRVTKASDDPVDFDRLQLVRKNTTDLSQYRKNIQTSMTRMQVADSTLDEISSILVKAKELAIATANGTLTSDTRRAAAVEVRGLRDTLMGMANHKIEGRYIFSGLATDTPTYAADGTFQGVDGAFEVEVGLERDRDISIDGRSIFDDPAGVNLAAVLEDFADALDNNDLTGITTAMTDLDIGREQVTAGRSEVGIIYNQLVLDDSLAEKVSLDMTAEDAALSEIDMAEAISNLMRLEYAMQSAVAVTQRSFEPGLLKYL